MKNGSLNIDYIFEMLAKEVTYRTSRSSGAGGQNVNKVSTKAELVFDIEQSQAFTDEQKEQVFKKLEKRITSNGLFILKCDTTRSQLKNKEIVLERFFKLITNALKPEKERKPTKPTISSVEKRLKDKKKLSDKKELRKPFSD